MRGARAKHSLFRNRMTIRRRSTRNLDHRISLDPAEAPDDAENHEPKAPELSPEELVREFETTYEAKDPNVPPNLCNFHFKEKEYKLYKPTNMTAQVHMCVHFKMDGNLILRTGEEAKRQVFEV
ncbi:hypothetical protein AAMO2058_000499500 [Amorphochlora amoebiformis]